MFDVMTWKRDAPGDRCWADRRSLLAGRTDECGLAATTRIGLCASHYREIFGEDLRAQEA